MKNSLNFEICKYDLYYVLNRLVIIILLRIFIFICIDDKIDIRNF